MGARSQGRRCVLGAVAAVAAAAAAPAHGAVQVSQSGWSWGNPTPQGNTLRAMQFVSGRGFAVGDAGTALRTDDGGDTWRGLVTGTTDDLVRLQVVTPDTLVVQGENGCVLRRSDDGGATFQRMYEPTERECPEPVQASWFVSPSVGYLLLRNGSVLRTADAGQTFSKQTSVPGTPTSPGGGSAQPSEIAFTSPDQGFAFTTVNGQSAEWSTTDDGHSWKPVTGLPTGVVTRVALLSATEAYAVGPGTLWHTADGGQTWEHRAAGDGQQLTSISCADSMTCLLTVAGGDRVLRTTDGGATATPITPSTQPIYAAAFASASRVVAGGAGGATVVSDDGGVNYAPIGGDIGGAYTALRAGPDASTAFALGLQGVIARTADGGTTWGTISVPTSADVRDASFPTQASGYALDVRGNLFQTANGGQSWRTLDTGAARPPLAVLALRSGTVLLGGPRGVRRQVGGGRFDPVGGRVASRAQVSKLELAGGAVFAVGGANVIRSTDGGRRWTAIGLPNPSHRRRNPLRIRDADFVDARHGYLVSTDGRLFSTTNGGRRWAELPGAATDGERSLAFADARQGFIALGAGGFAADPASAYVLRTTDGGRTWRPQRLSVGSMGGLTATTALRAFALTSRSGPGRQLFATATGGDSGSPSRLTLTTRARRLRARQLRRQGNRVQVTGTLPGAEGGEQVVVSRRDARGGRWVHQVVTVGANGGSFTATFAMRRTSWFVAEWAGDSGRRGAGTPVLTVTVR